MKWIAWLTNGTKCFKSKRDLLKYCEDNQIKVFRYGKIQKY